MTESPMEWAAEVLSSGEEIVVPVKELWRDMQSQRIGMGLSLEAFTAMLETDDRFELFAGVDHGDGDEEERAYMEELGFFSGPRVKLVSREMTTEYITRMLRQSTQSMLGALEEAWENRPTDDAEAEQQLLDVLTMAQQLKHEVDRTLEEVEAEGAADG